MVDKGAPAVGVVNMSPGLMQPLSSSHDNVVPLNFYAKYPPQVPTQTLEQWSKSIFEPSESIPTINLGRFGLKNASDVIQFMKSPAGESTLAEIAAKIALDEAINQEQQQALQQDLLRLRLQALLFLCFIDEKSEAAKEKLYLLIEEQNQIEIKHAGLTTAPEHNTSFIKHHLELAIADYDRAIKVAEERQSEIVATGKALAKEMEHLAGEGTGIEQKFSTYNKSLDELSQVVDSHIERDPERIQEMMNHYTAELTEQLDKINETIEADQDAKPLLNAHNALHLKVGSLHDMLAVHRGEKYYVDSNGHEVKSFKDADFVLRKEQKIINDNGKYYLLGANQDLNSIKDNPEARVQAEQAYERSKHDMMSVKKIVLHNNGLEITFHKQRVQELEDRVAVNKQNELQGSNTISSLVNDRSAALNLFKAINLNPKPTQGSTTRFYREQLQQHKTPPLSREELLALAEQAPAEHKEKAQAYLSRQFANMPRNAPIPFQKMQNILRNLERFGVDVTKPSVTSIQNDTEKNQSPKPKLEPF